MTSIYRKLVWKEHGPRPYCPCCRYWKLKGRGSGQDQQRVRRLVRKRLKRDLRKEVW